MDYKDTNIKFGIRGTIVPNKGKYILSISLISSIYTDCDVDEVSVDICNITTKLTNNEIEKSKLSKDSINEFVNKMKQYLVEPVDLIKDINLLYNDIKAAAKAISYKSSVTIVRLLTCKNTYDAELDIELYVDYNDNKNVIINRIAGKVDGCTVIANVDKACRTSKRIEDICQYLEESHNIDINSDVYTKINLTLEALQPKNDGNYIHLGGYDFLSAEIIYKIKMYVNKI